MIAYMRNRLTTEHTAVQLDSQEFYELRAAVGPDGRPAWEQTNYPDAKEQQERIAAGAPRPEDIGDEGQPVARIMDTGPGVEVDQDLGALSPGELAMVEEYCGGDEAEMRKSRFPEGVEDQSGTVSLEDSLANAKAGASEGDADDYGTQDKSDLESEVQRRRAAGREIEVEGTGSGGNVKKDDLIEALEDDDAEQDSENASAATS